MDRNLKVSICLIAVLRAPLVWAGPPFLTDDPQPVDYKHQEAYLFSTFDKGSDSKTIQAPAVEYNLGAAPNLQLHIVAPFSFFDSKDGTDRYGSGDLELGANYRFINEMPTFPQAGIFPMIELATGDEEKGLGNGRTWYKLPLWLQKSWRPWTTYAGGGYAVNQASGMRNHGFGGCFLQRTLTDHLTLGGEIFAQESDAHDAKGFTLYNLGGSYNFTSDVNLLFSGGHTFIGEKHAVGYLGLYWPWGLKG